MALQEYTGENILDLSREEGNIWCLIGMAQRLSRTLELDAKAIIAEMMKADYLNALYVFEREFGQFFTLKLPQGMTVEAIRLSHIQCQL